MGGLLRSDESYVNTKIPLLGDIPLMGKLFQHKETKKTDRELVIFITPRIMDSSDENSANQILPAAGVLKGEQSVSDLRTGMITQEMDRVSNK